MTKDFKLRLFPSKKQQHTLIRYIGACRFIWDYFLDLRIERDKNGGKKPDVREMLGMIKSLQAEKACAWLRSIPLDSLGISVQMLGEALMQFDKGKAESPRFWSRKHGRMELPVGNNSFYFMDDSHVLVARVGKIRFEGDGAFPIGKDHEFYNIRVFMEGNDWFVTFAMECEESK